MTDRAVLVTALLFILLTASTFAGTSEKIHPWVISNTAGGQQAEFFIVLKEKSDLSPAFKMPRKIDRGNFVYKTLFDTAQHSQVPLKEWLQNRGINYQSFYIINALLVRAGREIVDELAAREDVDRIEGNPVIRNAIPQPEFESESLTNAVQAIEWNIDRTNAPDLWALGFTGQGIVVGGADTGYRWTHNALKSKYRGDGPTPDHDYNWHDSIHSGGGSCGADATAPCDDNGHGTHTMGTVLGDDGGSNQIGMAPGAKWIGCRNMNQGNGTPATYIECFEFFLAPYPVGGTPAEGDPSMAPDVTTNSWSCPPSEGCSANSLQAAIDAQEAAGIMTVVAAQNSGPSCGTVNDPPALYQSSYVVGSTTSSNLLSSFSSRGPADSTGLMKPSIVAPGSSIRSASRTTDSSYTTLSGTSMATPNVAGGVALVWSALSAYKNDQDATEALLNGGATPLPHIVESCGGNYVIGPNNSWGYGLMDVFSAFQDGCTAPSAPQNLASSIDSNNHVSLTWDVMSGVTEYRIYRGSGSCPGSGFTEIANTSDPSFIDTTVTAGNTYSYMVTAFNLCESSFSNCTDETIAPACLYCDDFEDGLLPNWTFVKPFWNEMGGSLVGTPNGKKAVAVASPAFSGCLNCTIQTQMNTAGGTKNILWLLGWYVDKKNTIELLMKQDTGKWILKQRSGGSVVAKASVSMAISPNTVYDVSLSFNGTQFQLMVNSIPVLNLTPAQPVSAGTVGFQVRNTTGQFGEINVN